METRKVRNPGLDICRVAGMFGIIMLHILGRGGLDSSDIHTAGYWVAWWLEILAFCSVDLFALLTGYLNCEKTVYSYWRLYDLLLSVLFYSVVSTALFGVLKSEVFTDWKTVAFSIFPPLAGRYWYITCYIMVFLLMPYLNLMLGRLNENALKKLCLMLFVFCAVIPSLFDVDFFKQSNGYSVAWLIVCYILGAGYRKFGKKLFTGAEYLVILISTSVVLWLRFFRIHSPFGSEIGYMMDYTSPFLVVNALMILQLGVYYKGRLGPKSIKAWSHLADCAFDVYLVHSQILVFDYVLNDLFVWVASLNPIVIPLAVLLSAAEIYTFGSLSAGLRRIFFKLIGLDKLVSRCKNMEYVGSI